MNPAMESQPQGAPSPRLPVVHPPDAAVAPEPRCGAGPASSPLALVSPASLAPLVGSVGAVPPPASDARPPSLAPVDASGLGGGDIVAASGVLVAPSAGAPASYPAMAVQHWMSAAPGQYPGVDS
jgi:hypothetical protein